MSSSRWFVLAILLAIVGTTVSLRETTRQRDAIREERRARVADTDRLTRLCDEITEALATLSSEFETLRLDVQELALTQAEESAQRLDLQQTTANLNAALLEFAIALDTPVDEYLSTPASEPEQEVPPPLETARLLTIDDIPARLRDYVQPNTVLVSGHDAKWGQFRVKIAGENIPLIDSAAAEACALLHSELRLMRRLAQEDAIAKGDCLLFDSREEASTHAQNLERRALLLGKERPNSAIRAWGDQFAYVPGELYLETPEVLALRKQIRLLGKRLLAGRPGRYGVLWTSYD